jgi:hypothetical protein
MTMQALLLFHMCSISYPWFYVYVIFVVFYKVPLWPEKEF